MPKLSDAYVEIRADTRKLVTGLQRVRARVFSAAKNLARVFVRAFTPMRALLASLVAGGGFILLMRRQFQLIDSLGKTADKLGMTTEALASLRHAAELSGVPIRTLDMALQRMIRRLSEAAVDTGEAKDAIKELGLSARFLNKLAPEEAFARIADAMKRVRNSADRVRLAFKLFDSEGVAVVNTLMLGSRGLAKAADEARKLGIALDRVTVKSIEKTIDAINRMKAAISGALSALAIQIAPFIKKAADAFTRWATTGTTLAEKVRDIARFIAKQIAWVVDMILKGVALMLRAIHALTRGLWDIGHAIVTVTHESRTALEKVFGPQAVTAMNKLGAGLANSMADAGKSIGGLIVSLEKLNAQKGVAGLFEKLDKAIARAKLEMVAKTLGQVAKSAVDAVREMSPAYRLIASFVEVGRNIAREVAKGMPPPPVKAKVKMQAREGLAAILTRQRGAAFTGGLAGLVGAVTAPRLDPLRESVTIQRDMLGHLQRIEKGIYQFSAVGNN